MAYPSKLERTALRRALRSHAQAETVLAGRLVNNLTLSELHICLTTLGLDPLQIAREATLIEARTYPETPACDNLPQPVIMQACSCPCPMGNHTPQCASRHPVETVETVSPAETDPSVEAELQSLRQLVGTGGFAALDDRLRSLVIEARKPPIEVRVEVPVDVVPGAPVHVAKKTGQSATWRQLFHVHGRALAGRETELWDGSHPNTPRVNEAYIWPQPQTAIALSQIARCRNVFLWGPAGTGKTEWPIQLAAKTGRPFALISCDAGTDASTLVGMTVPDASGGVTWQDGQLTRAIRTPGCVICIDEPSVARPGALFVLQNVLANRVLYIAETGQRVPVAGGVLFVATDNTNGTGGGSRKGYTDTNRLNAAFLDRFGVRVKFDYLSADKEAAVIVGYTGCTLALAQLLVKGAAVTRAAANDQTLSHGIGLRRLLAWAELLTDGVEPEAAFNAAVLDCAPEQDVETLREQLLLCYDRRTVAEALNPSQPVAADPAITNPTPAGRSAASDFGTIHTA